MRTRVNVDRAPLAGLLAANAISELGNVVTLLAIPWFVLQTTGSAARTGVAAFFFTLPQFVAGFFGGPIIDRLGFKRVSIAADVMSGVTVALIPALYSTAGLSFVLLLVLIFLGNLLDTPGKTARSSMLPDLAATCNVPLERVNSIYQSIQRFALLAGPPFAGGLISLVGASQVLWVDAATYLVSMLTIWVFVPSLTATRPEGNELSYLRELKAGLRLLQGDQLLLPMFIVVAVANGLINPLFGVVLPVYADRVLGNAVDLGLMVACFGGGTLLGGLGFGTIGHRLPRRKTFVSCFFLTAVPLMLLSTTPRLFPSLVLLLLLGIAAGPIGPLTATAVQERTPSAMRGRIFGSMAAVSSAVVPVGLVAAGLALQHFSLTATLIVLACIFFATAVSTVLHPATALLDQTSAENLQVPRP